MRGVDGSVTALAQRLRRLARALTGDRTSADALALAALDELTARTSLVRAYRAVIRRNRERELARGALLTHPPVRDIAGAFATLALEDREVLALVVVEDMSYRDAAGALDMSLDRFLAVLTQARSHLAARVEAGRPVVLRLVK